METLKRWMGLLLAALLAFGMTACGLEISIDYSDDFSSEAFQEETDFPASELDDSRGDNFANTSEAELDSRDSEQDGQESTLLAEDGSYTSKEDVALYIYQYGCLPSNFITKKEAEKLGWSGGSLEPYAPGMCIGGSRFGNYEGLLPERDGRIYTECDIDTLGARSRGAKRIVFSNDGLIFYTEDHYESFELLYGGE